ncbi:MAG: nuclear transport factor 2 family protein [Pseudomonadota bacterium]
MARIVLAAVVAASLAGGMSMADETEITRSITDIAAGADRHDWERVRTAFADTVTTDYTSLWGGEPATQPADDFVSGWAAFLPGFDSTHHMVTNHAVTWLEGASATAQADFTATHRLGDALWVLGGRYDYGLQNIGGRWKVTSLTMTALWESGDRGLVATAAERASQSN